MLSSAPFMASSDGETRRSFAGKFSGCAVFGLTKTYGQVLDWLVIKQADFENDRWIPNWPPLGNRLFGSLSWARRVVGSTCDRFVEIYIAVAYFDIEATVWITTNPGLVV